METALDITPNMAELIVIDDEGLCVFSGEKTYSPVRLKAPMAFGHGREYAMGAMAMGANASDAVTIANEYSLHCGKGVACYTIHPDEKGDN
jgi:predicted lipoprotein with Yx(FWY)xxD motif